MMAEGGEKVACLKYRRCEEYNEARPQKFGKNCENSAKKQERGASLRAKAPRLILPASAVSEQEDRESCFTKPLAKIAARNLFHFQAENLT